ncbi:MFS transporter small subunit [Amycolatopsis samaneae]|uniref:Uncharacterized protein n=1 Tax=Amycolatopsis samaneae TaxID=664691 RepID=A0ABW5GU73_9PSEU
MSEPTTPAARSRAWLIVLAWAWVLLPFVYGVYELIRKVVQLFG